MPFLLKKIKKFEQDCELWDTRSDDPTKILPPKSKAADDDSVEAERPDRVLMDILYGLPKDSVKMISPDSLMLKTYNKFPLLIFTNLAAITSSMSEMSMKIMGCILKDAHDWVDYVWVIPATACLIYTALRTLVYVNYGIKYYGQMEVMPIYQTCLLNHNILVGMLCLNELKFYTWQMLCGIFLSTLCCCIGIYVLLEKNKDKRPAIYTVEEGVEMKEITGQKVKFAFLKEEATQETNNLETAEDMSVKHELHLNVQTEEDIRSEDNDYD